MVIFNFRHVCAITQRPIPGKVDTTSDSGFGEMAKFHSATPIPTLIENYIL